MKGIASELGVPTIAFLHRTLPTELVHADAAPAISSGGGVVTVTDTPTGDTPTKQPAAAATGKLLVPSDTDYEYRVRWFTPSAELPLCGHATLAAAHALYSSGRVKSESVTIKFRSYANSTVIQAAMHDPPSGLPPPLQLQLHQPPTALLLGLSKKQPNIHDLKADSKSSVPAAAQAIASANVPPPPPPQPPPQRPYPAGLIWLEFSTKRVVGNASSSDQKAVLDSLGLSSSQLHESMVDCGTFWLIRVRREATVDQVTPDFQAMLSASPERGVIITATSDGTARGVAGGASQRVDIVSRVFCPHHGINEDHVTGSAHTALIPYWSPRLHRSLLTAFQASPRGGILYGVVLGYDGSRVALGGHAVTVSVINLLPPAQPLLVSM